MAERLHISQSAVSMAIKRLEEAMGLILFERTQGQRSLKLTHEGEIFFLEMEKMHKSLAQGVLEKLLEKSLFPIKIGVFFHLGRDFLYPALASLEDEKTKLAFHCYAVIKNKSILSAVQSGELDCGLLCSPPLLNQVHYVKLRKEPYSFLGLKRAFPKLDTVKNYEESMQYPRAYEYLGDQAEDNFQNIKSMDNAFHASEHFSTRVMVLAGIMADCLYHHLFSAEERKLLNISKYRDISVERYAYFIWNKDLSEQRLKNVLHLKKLILEIPRS